MFRYILKDWSVNTCFKSRFILVSYRLCSFFNTSSFKFFLFPLFLFHRIIIEWFIGAELNSKLVSGSIRLFHGQGLVIHPDTIIGNNVTLRCNTVIGIKEDSMHAPRIGSNVDIGANSVIIGNICIGDNVKIGAGSVVTRDIPAGSTVVGNPAKVISSYK